MKTLKFWLTATAMLLCSLSASAHDCYVNRVYYNLDKTNQTATVTFKGSSHNSYSNEYSGEVVIPESFSYNGTTYNVTSIGDFSFFKCSSLSSITIPNSVTSIGYYAFSACSGLLSITIPNSVTSIESYAFFRCTGLLSITIPNSVTSIGTGAFQYCSSLSSITIPNSVTSIAKSTFWNCSGLSSITIPNSVTTIESDAFSGCNPSKVIWLTNTPPSGYTNLNGAINYVANDQYSGLNQVKIYPYLSSMFEADGVKYVPVSPSERTCDAIDCVYENAAERIEVKETVSFKGVEMKVKEIMPYTFYNNNAIKEVSMSNHGSIGEQAFRNCSALTNVELGSRVKTIENNAFCNCSSLPEINLPQSVIKIGDYVFSGCKKLSDVVIEDRTQALALGSNGSSPLFADCPLDSVYIGGKITYSTTSSKGYSPFYRNTSLRTVVITDQEEQIYTNEFYGCPALKNVSIGNGVKSIGNNAFSSCNALEGFSFGSNMESIGDEAFSDCNNLTSLSSYAITPPVCGTQALDDINKWNCVLRVPTGYAAAYQAAEQWKEFFFVEGVMAVKKYALTYVVDGEVYHVDSLAHKETIILPETPVKEGYTFSGWSEVPETMPAQDVTVTGTFSINKYLLQFVVEDNVIASDSIEYGAAIITPEAPEKEGHTFSGWSEVPETMPAQDVTVTGTFSINKYLLQFVVEDNVIASDSIEYGAAIIAPEAPEKEGHTFSGWSDVPETMPAQDVTVTGTFSINKYLLQFVVEDNVIASDSIEYGAAIVTPEAPEKEGHTFSGWSDVPETMPAQDVTITGTYSINKYLLQFVVEDNVIASDSIEYGAAIVTPEAPEKEGHTFSGWSEVPETMPAQDVTITGTYSINKYLLQFVIDENVIASDSIEYGAAIVTPEAPEKEGHTFSGWSNVPETMPAQDVTVTGTFSINKYLLQFVVEDKVIASDSIEYGAAIVTPEAPEKEGHTFSGWSEVPETMPAQDVTVTGTYSINKYLLQFVIEDNVITSDSIEYGAAIVTPEAPEKEGHTFSGWSDVPETMPAQDVTITGTYSVNIYQLIYIVDGEEYAKVDVAYGDAITLIEAPVKEGYTFSGWSETPETMPAHDVEVTGSFTVDDIEKIVVEHPVDVYDLSGNKVKSQVAPEDALRDLPSGLYIVNGKKILVK